MNYIIDLKPHIGSEKTLVISGDNKNQNLPSLVNSVFLFNVPQGMLFRYDRQQHETLLHYVYEKECSQIIYVAASQSGFLEQLERRDSPRSLHLATRFHVSVLLRNNEDKILPDRIKRQMLLELHTIEQCKLLTDHFFIRKKIDCGEMKVKGLVPQLDSGRFKSIFHNEISYDNLLTMN